MPIFTGFEPSTYVRAQYIIILDCITYQRAQNLINIGKIYLRAQSTYVHKNIKNIKIKKNRESGAFRGPISVLCYDWNISVWLGSTNGSSCVSLPYFKSPSTTIVLFSKLALVSLLACHKTFVPAFNNPHAEKSLSL